MALEIGTATYQMLKRWRNVNINKTMTNPAQLTLTLDVDTGFYDEQGRWVATATETLQLDGDAAWFIFGLTEDVLGLQDEPLGRIVDATIYGVLAERIPTNALLNVVAFDAATGWPLAGTWQLRKDGRPVAYGQTDHPQTLPIVLGAELVVSVDGHEPATVQLDVIAGIVDVPVYFGEAPEQLEEPTEGEPEEPSDELEDEEEPEGPSEPDEEQDGEGEPTEPPEGGEEGGDEEVTE